jgi:hypothetical protein
MDNFEVFELGMIGFGEGGLDHGFLQILEFYERQQCIGHLTSLPIAVVGSLDVPLIKMVPLGPNIFRTR